MIVNHKNTIKNKMIISNNLKSLNKVYISRKIMLSYQTYKLKEYQKANKYKT